MKRFDEQEIEAVTSVIASGNLSQFFKDFNGGCQIQAFERELADYLKVKHVITVSNGTVALEILLNALRIGRGDEVIVPALSFIATATAVLRVGAKPVFVDIYSSTLNIDPSAVKEALTPKTAGVIAVSLNGIPANMEFLRKEIDSEKYFLIEDAAQALGAEINGKKIGTFGDAATFSFQETKSLTTLGEGGAIVTNDAALAEECRYIRNHGNIYGSSPRNHCVCTNARMTEAQAAFGRIQLQKLDHFNSIQHLNAIYFYNKLAELPNAPIKRIPQPPLQYDPTYLLIPTFLKNPQAKQDFLNAMTKSGLSQGIPGQNVGYYKKLLYEFPIFSGSRQGQRNISIFNWAKKCPEAEWVKDHTIIFDIHRWNKTTGDIDKAIEIIASLS